MSHSVELFYDDLSEQYHLISSGWDETVKSQGQILNQLLRSKVTKSILDILDCSCGIGTQAIGLAINGHNVFASDLSSKAVERAQAEADRFGVRIQFGVADFRKLKDQVPGEFDVVVSCDNSIPHLLTQDDLHLAFNSIFVKLRPKGYVLISMRDYDQIRNEMPIGMPPKKITDKHGTRIYMQTGDWNSAGDSYELELFLMKQSADAWITTSFKTRYRAWLRNEISPALATVGFKNIQWLMPADTGYYQPIIMAAR